MSTLEFLQRLAYSAPAPHEREKGFVKDSSQGAARGTAKLLMVLDGLTILVAAVLATHFELHTGPLPGVKQFWHGALIHGRPMWILSAFLCGYTISLIIICWRLNLYPPRRLGFLHEQRLSVQACLISGLLLTGTIYLVHVEDIPRSIVLITLGLVTLLLSLRRLVYQVFLHACFKRNIGTHNVLIVGTGSLAHALRHRLERVRHLGYVFKGFIDFPGSGSSFTTTSGDVVGTLDTLFQFSRRHFVDEIFFTTPCDREILQDVLEHAQTERVDLRVVPDMYGGLAWNKPIEYIDQFPTIS